MTDKKYLDLDGLQLYDSLLKTKVGSDINSAVNPLSDRVDDIEDKLDGIEDGAQANVIESISLNGVEQTIVNKGVNLVIDIPEGVELLENKVTTLTEGSTDTQYPSAKAVYNAIVDVEFITTKSLNDLEENKVDKVAGKGLSTNDYTTAEKTKLTGIADGAQVNAIESISLNGTAQTITNKGVNLTVNQAKDYVVVDELPTPSASTMNNLYFVTVQEPSTQSNESSGIDWDLYRYVDAGSFTQYTNRFKIAPADTDKPHVENIQQPGFASEVGIYVWISEAITSINIDSAIQGAGAVLYLSSFTMKETLVTITYGSNSFSFWVYNRLGDDPTVNPSHDTYVTHVNSGGVYYWEKIGISSLDDYLTKSEASSTYQTKSNLVTSVSTSSTDDQYVSAKCVYTLINSLITRIAELEARLEVDSIIESI